MQGAKEMDKVMGKVMEKVIYSSIMKHIEATTNEKEISGLNKDLYRIAPTLPYIDEVDLIIIDKLIHKYDFNRLTSRREISFTQFVLEFFPSPGYLDYAHVLKRLLSVSTLTMANGVKAEGKVRSYHGDNFKMYIANGPELNHNVIVFSHLFDGFEFKLTENDVILTLTINMNQIDYMRELNHI